uniref:Venom CRiSP 1 n=1 Tax=Oncocephalus sp. TaxID=2944721 RepID=A0AB38ZEW3_9HEMI
MMKIVQFAALFCLLFTISGIESAKWNLACKNGNKLLGMKSLTEQDKQKLLQVHNKYRNTIASGKAPGQPPAENMLELTWDSYAEKQAFSWASGCVFEHNSPKDINNNPMGQNLYMKMSTLREDVNATFYEWTDSMVEGWYNEVRQYRFGSGFSPATGHYTQLAWAKTAKLGCGYSYYVQNNWNAGYLVCNYDPAGNYIGENPYKVGKVNCKANNLEPSTKYSHLCVKKK